MITVISFLSSTTLLSVIPTCAKCVHPYFFYLQFFSLLLLFLLILVFLISKYDFSCTIMLISFLVRNFLVRYLSYVVYHLLFITCASRIRFWDIYFHLTKQFILIKTEWYIKLIQKMNNSLLEKLEKKKEKKTCDLFYFFIRRIL